MRTDDSNDMEIFTFSGNSRDAVKAVAAEMLSEYEKPDAMQDLAELAKRSREAFNPEDFSRLAMVVPPGALLPDCLKNALRALDSPGEIDTAQFAGIFYGEDKPPGKIAFLFPGQGSQYIAMGRDLVNAFPRAQTVIDRMEALFDHEQTLWEYMYPEAPKDKTDKNRQEDLLRQTDVAQPAIGTISLIMTYILSMYRLFPDAAAGHSYGELSALCAGKRISENDFLRLSVWRGRLMADAAGTDKGQMLAVKAHPDMIGQLVKSTGVDVVLANKNSPEQGVLSGSSDEIEKMVHICRENRIRAMLLPVAAAFHSRLVFNAADGFRQKIRQIEILPGPIPVYSNKTALPYPADEKEAAHLLGKHLESPVHFMDQIMNMHSDGIRVFVEVGPKNVLTGLVHSTLKGSVFTAFSMDASAGKNSGLYDLAVVLCRLGAAGYPIDFRPWKSPERISH